MQAKNSSKVYLSMFDGMLISHLALGMVTIGVSAFIHKLLPNTGADLQMMCLLLGSLLLVMSLPGLYKYRREPALYSMLAWILLVLSVLVGVVWLINTYVPFKVVMGIGIGVAAFSLLYVWVLRSPERV